MRLLNTKEFKKEVFTIPNLLSFFRLVLIPVFVYLYINAESVQDSRNAAMVILVSTITDFLDGQIARRFNMISRLGKVLDPIADKLTHIVVVLCISGKYPLMWVLVAVYLVKEGYLVIKGLLVIKQGLMMNGAMWFGKICTALFFVMMVILLWFTQLPIQLVNGMVIVMSVMMVVTLIMYIKVYAKIETNGHFIRVTN